MRLEIPDNVLRRTDLPASAKLVYGFLLARPSAMTAPVREIARGLGLGHATTARALERLRGAGLLGTSQNETTMSQNETPAPQNETSAPGPLAWARQALLGTALDTPRFWTAWHEWVRHRRQRRAPLTECAVRRQVRKLEALGHDRAIATIERSIEHGWIGLFPAREAPGRLPAQTAEPVNVPMLNLRRTSDAGN